MFKDNKVPGTRLGTRAAEAPSRGTGSAAGFLGESQAGLCERLGACLDQGNLNRRNISKRKRENRGTQWLFREFSTEAWPLAPRPPQPLNCEHQISSPSTHLKSGWCTPVSEAWAPKPETPGWVHTVISSPAARAHSAQRPRLVHNPINGLVAHRQPRLKHQGLNISHLAPVHRTLQGLLAL